jgi:aspartate/methionine/tyrosine aminotransferase
VHRLGTESAFTVLARAQELERAGRSVVHLEIGEPDFPTLDHVVAAAVEGLAAGLTHYGATAGTPELREAAAAYFRRTRNLDVEAANCLIGTGAKPFIFFTILATCGPGDEVIVPDPAFPAYESAVRFAGATPVPILLDGEDDFRVDPERLQSLLSSRTRLVVLNAPHNPTGGSLDAATVEALARVLETTDAWVFSDEVYCQLQYDEPFRSIGDGGRLAERLIILDSMSKTYAMTGWRCGFATLPAPLIEPLVRFFVNSTSCVPPFVQHAAVAALEGPQDCVDSMREQFIRRRSLVVGGLNEIAGIRCGMPAGAFYAFPNVSALPVSAEELADRLLEEAGVAVLPGSAFGPGGKDYVRISYANSEANLERALDRIAALVATL